MIRVSVETLVMGNIPGACLIVLRPVAGESTHDRVLPICIGPVEAAAIGKAISGERSSRPMTHSLLGTVMATLGGKLESISINSVKGTIFYATLNITQSGTLHQIDARPSDAVALAIRLKVPMYVDEKVIASASFPTWVNIKSERERTEIQEFHKFIESVSPEDFATEKLSHTDTDSNSKDTGD